MLRAALPVFVKVTVCAELVVPMFSFVKVREPVERLTIGPVTLSVVEPVTEPNVAEIVAVPTPSAVAIPIVPAASLMTATAIADELHVAVVVRFCVLPSL